MTRLVSLRQLCSGDGGLFTDGDWVESPHITDFGNRLIQTGNIGLGVFREQGFRYISDESFEGLGCTQVVRGDVLICRLAAPVGRACLAPDLGCRALTSVDVCIARPSQKIVDRRYLVYYMSSTRYLGEIDAIARGGTRQRISRDQLGSVRVPVPSLGHQRAIADFLDAETARIENLVSKERQLVRLVNEQIDGEVKRLVGASALVDGEPTVPVLPIKRLLTKLNRPPVGTEMVTAYRDGQVTARSLRRPEGYTEASAEGTLLQGVRRDDVVVHGLDAFSGAIGASEVDGVCSPIYHVCSPSDGGDAVYFGRLLRILAISGYLGLFATSTRERAVDLRNWDLFGRIPVPLVNPEIQRKIATQIRDLAPLNDAVEKTAALAAEHRQALITATVTGELAVPGVAA